MSELHSKKIRAKRMRRKRSHLRLRNRIQGSAERPRLTVFKSLRFTYAQVIDDSSGVTLAQANSREADVQSAAEGSNQSCEAAKVVGEKIAERLKEKGIEQVVFDRGGFAYHGRIKAVADGARSGGLQF